MKFNFKKVTAVATSMLMTTMAFGVASAVQYPDNWSSNSVAVVYGSGMSEDGSVATTINEDIKDNIDFDESSADTSAEKGDESVDIEGTGSDVNMDDDLHEVEQSLDEDELSDLLGTGNIEDQDGEDVEYEQELNFVDGNNIVQYSAFGDIDYYMGNNSDLSPVVNIDQSDASYRSSVEFDDPIDMTELTDSESFEIMGEEYTVDPDMADGDDELVLFQGSETVNVGLGESATVNGDSIKVTGVDASGDNNKATVSVNGNSETLEEGEENEDYRVNEIAVNTIGDESASVELFIGSEEVVIDENDGFNDVELEGEDIEGLTADLANDDITNVEEITFEITPGDMDADEKQYLQMGESLEDPLAGSLLLNFEGANPEIESEDKSLVEIDGGSDLSIDFTSRNGNEYSITPFEENDGNIEDGEDWFVDADTQQLTGLQEDDKFLASEGDGSSKESLLLQVDSIDNDEDTVNINGKDYDSGEQIEDTGLYVSDITETNFDLVDSDSNQATYDKSVVTENGMEITLNRDGDDAANGEQIILEEDVDEDVEDEEAGFGPKTFDLRTDDDDDISMSEPGEFISDDKDDNSKSYYLSDLGTYITFDSDDDESMDVMVTGEETDYSLSVSSAASSDDDSGETPDVGSKVYTDDESYENNDVVVAVGGSCVNSAAAEALGLSKGACGSDWVDATGAGSGQFYIEKVSDAYGTGATAVVVAGYSASDTEAAGNAFVEKDMSLPSEGKVYKTATKEVVTAQ